MCVPPPFFLDLVPVPSEHRGLQIPSLLQAYKLWAQQAQMASPSILYELGQEKRTSKHSGRALGKVVHCVQTKVSGKPKGEEE